MSKFIFELILYKIETYHIIFLNCSVISCICRIRLQWAWRISSEKNLPAPIHFNEDNGWKSAHNRLSVSYVICLDEVWLSTKNVLAYRPCLPFFSDGPVFVFACFCVVGCAARLGNLIKKASFTIRFKLPQKLSTLFRASKFKRPKSLKLSVKATFSHCWLSLLLSKNAAAHSYSYQQK